MTGYVGALASRLCRLVTRNYLQVVYFMILALLLSPLWPLDIVLMLSLSVYTYYIFKKNSLLLIGISIIYVVLSLMNYHVVGLVVLAGYIITSLIAMKKFLLSLGVVFSTLLTYQVLKLSSMVIDYLLALKMFFIEDGYEAVGIHVVVLLTILVYVFMSSSFFRDTRIGRYFIENPGAYPIIQFMVLLIYAAIRLIYGEEALANKYAELAYYSLVVGIALSIPHTLAGNSEEQE